MLLGLLGATLLVGQAIAEGIKGTIPSSYWNNQKLMTEDKLNTDVSPEQIMKNLQKGKYNAPNKIPYTENFGEFKHPIVNRKQYQEDIKRLGLEIANWNANIGRYASMY